MFKVTATGKNPNYGKKNQVRLVNNNGAMFGVRQGWLKPTLIFVGDIRNRIRIIDMSQKCRKCGR